MMFHRLFCESLVEEFPGYVPLFLPKGSLENLICFFQWWYQHGKKKGVSKLKMLLCGK